MKKLSLLLALLLLVLSLAGCGKADVDTSATDDALGDSPTEAVDLYADFRETDVFDTAHCYYGYYVTDKNVVCRVADEKYLSVIMPLDMYNIYVIRPTEEQMGIKAFMLNYNPLEMSVNDTRALSNGDTQLELFSDIQQPEIQCLPKTEGKYLLVYIPDFKITDKVEIGKSTILLDEDSGGDWWIPETVGAVDGSEGSWADWNWNSSQIYNNLYGPLRAKYPDYISSETIGVDQTGKYHIIAYTFEPEDYEQVMILTTGMHGNEIDAYLAVAKFCELLANEDGSHAGLHYIRTKVKLVVIPIVNVWSSNNKHIYRNSANVNINRDYIDKTQSETRAVIKILERYQGIASCILDFHCYNLKDTNADLYYKCNLSAPNAPAVYKAVNHIYQRLCEKDLAAQPAIIERYPIDSLRGNHTLLGTAWNIYNIPSMTVEHSMDHYYENHSEESVTLALENFGNIIIQHALLKIRTVEK